MNPACIVAYIHLVATCSVVNCKIPVVNCNNNRGKL